MISICQLITILASSFQLNSCDIIPVYPLSVDSLYFKSGDIVHYFNLVTPGMASGESFPLFIFIDPAGRADIPLRLYEDVFKEKPCFAVCSWEIKNGPVEKNEELLSSLQNYLVKNYPVNMDEIYLAGFSGGSRLASDYAARNGGIKTIIGCGSGLFPTNLKQEALLPFYIGVVGISDMNLSEMIQNYLDLMDNNKPQYLLITESGHEWPDSKNFQKALQIAGYFGNAPTENSLEDESAKIKTYLEKGYVMEAYFSNLSLEKFLNTAPGRANTGSLTMDRYKDQAYSFLEQEQIEIYKFKTAINLVIARGQGFEVEEKSKGWWKKEIKKINQRLEKNSAPEIIEQNKRLLSFIRANLYENARIRIDFENDKATGEKLLELWQLSDPKNPMVSYSISLHYYNTKQFEKAAKYLEAAIENGIGKCIDPQRIENLKKELSLQ